MIYLDDDEAPLKRKEQQDHELSGVQPKHQRLSSFFLRFLIIFKNIVENISSIMRNSITCPCHRAPVPIRLGVVATGTM